MGLFRDLSIRNKILGGFALVLLAVLGLGLSSISSLSTVQGKVQTLVEQSTPAALKSVAISDLIKEATASLGFHLLSKTEEDAATLQRQIGQVDGLLVWNNCPPSVPMNRAGPNSKRSTSVLPN